MFARFVFATCFFLFILFPLLCAAHCAPNSDNTQFESFSIQFSHRSQELFFRPSSICFAFLGQVAHAKMYLEIEIECATSFHKR